MWLMFTSWFFLALIFVSVCSYKIDNGSFKICDPKHGHDRQDTTSLDTIFSCPATYGRYPHKMDCALFYECSFGYPHLMKCDKYKLYDDEKKQCIDKCSVDCNRKEQNKKELDNDETYKCPFVLGMFAHPTLCSKYYMCVQDIPTLFQCYGSTVFDTRSRECLERSRVDCGNRLDRDDFTPTEIPSTPTSTVATFPFTTSTTTMNPITTTERSTTTTDASTTAPTPTSIPTIEATSTTISPTATPTTTTETPATESPTAVTPTSTVKITKPNTPPPTDCDENDLDCIMDKTGNVADWFECPGNGLFPHGSSQQLFIHCDNDKPFVQNCGEGTYFSPEYKVCMWIKKPDDE